MKAKYGRFQDGPLSLCIDPDNDEERGVLQHLAACRGSVVITSDAFGRLIMTFKELKH